MTTYKTVDCARCRGTGKYTTFHGGYFSCDICNETGKIKIPTDAKTCPKCKGTGVWYIDGTKCTKCDGIGRIMIPTPNIRMR